MSSSGVITPVETSNEAGPNTAQCSNAPGVAATTSEPPVVRRGGATVGEPSEVPTVNEHHTFFPARAQVAPGLQPRDTEFHDVLLFPPRRKETAERVIDAQQFFRFPVIKKDVAAGEDANGKPRSGREGIFADPPERWGASDMGQRKVLSVAQPHRVLTEPSVGEERGAAFGVLPIKPEPGASSCAWCYLVNPENMLSPNAWTAKEWNAPGGAPLPAEANADKAEVEVLLALPRGIVVRFKASGLDNLDTLPEQVETAQMTKHGATYEVEPIRLNHESEVWNQLRSGLVAGRVLHRGKARVVPLVNVTSLMSGSASQGKH